MSPVKRALFISTGERYFLLASNFIRVALVSRLLTPSEIGVSVIGMAIVAIAMSAREFVSASFLIQRENLTRDDIRGAFSAMLIITGAISGLLMLVAPWLAESYREPNLVPYLHVIAVCLLVELFSTQILTLLKRDMLFGKVAVINISSTITGIAATVGLALLGFSFMSFAWAWLAGSVVAGVLALSFRPQFWMFVPSFKNWRALLEFGGYNGITVVLFKLYDQLPYLMLGQLVSPNAAGLFSRCQTICELPDKILLGGVVQVILPAFAAEVRQGRDLRAPYLNALGLVTAVLWPAHVIIATLAYPIVAVLLGSQWHEVAPLVQIVALASLFAFSFELNYPVLVAKGAIRDVFVRALIVFPIAALIVVVSTHLGGLHGTAWGMMVIVPFHALVALHFVKRRIALAWLDILRAVQKSTLVTAFCAAGPLSIAATAGYGFDMPVLYGIAGGALGGLGWIAGVYLTRHPMLGEIARLVPPLGRRVAAPL